MKRIYVPSILAVIFLFASCATLQNSQIDEAMRFQGSFACKPISEEKPGLKETLAEADVARVRCAKDEVNIQGEQLMFTRTLYQSKSCSGPLGRIQFNRPYKIVKNELLLEAPQCKLIRLNPSWLGEASGKCMLNKLNLDQPYPLHQVYACPNYIPRECQGDQQIAVEALAVAELTNHEPFVHLNIHILSAKNHASDCERYAKP